MKVSIVKILVREGQNWKPCSFLSKSKWLQMSFKTIKLLFVCLHNWSFHAETHLHRDGTRFEQNTPARLKKKPI